MHTGPQAAAHGTGLQSSGGPEQTKHGHQSGHGADEWRAGGAKRWRLDEAALGKGNRILFLSKITAGVTLSAICRLCSRFGRVVACNFSSMHMHSFLEFEDNITAEHVLTSLKQARTLDVLLEKEGVPHGIIEPGQRPFCVEMSHLCPPLMLKEKRTLVITFNNLQQKIVCGDILQLFKSFGTIQRILITERQYQFNNTAVVEMESVDDAREIYEEFNNAYVWDSTLVFVKYSSKPVIEVHFTYNSDKYYSVDNISKATNNTNTIGQEVPSTIINDATTNNRIDATQTAVGNSSCASASPSSGNRTNSNNINNIINVNYPCIANDNSLSSSECSYKGAGAYNNFRAAEPGENGSIFNGLDNPTGLVGDATHSKSEIDNACSSVRVVAKFSCRQHNAECEDNSATTKNSFGIPLSPGEFIYDDDYVDSAYKHDFEHLGYNHSEFLDLSVDSSHFEEKYKYLLHDKLKDVTMDPKILATKSIDPKIKYHKFLPKQQLTMDISDKNSRAEDDNDGQTDVYTQVKQADEWSQDPVKELQMSLEVYNSESYSNAPHIHGKLSNEIKDKNNNLHLYSDNGDSIRYYERSLHDGSMTSVSVNNDSDCTDERVTTNSSYATDYYMPLSSSPKSGPLFTQVFDSAHGKLSKERKSVVAESNYPSLEDMLFAGKINRIVDVSASNSSGIFSNSTSSDTDFSYNNNNGNTCSEGMKFSQDPIPNKLFVKETANRLLNNNSGTLTNETPYPRQGIQDNNFSQQDRREALFLNHNIHVYKLGEQCRNTPKSNDSLGSTSSRDLKRLADNSTPRSCIRVGNSSGDKSRRRNIILVSNLPGAGINPISLAHVFLQYGQVIAVKIVREKHNKALVKMENHDQAVRCIKMLNGVKFFGSNLNIVLSIFAVITGNPDNDKHVMITRTSPMFIFDQPAERPSPVLECIIVDVSVATGHNHIGPSQRHPTTKPLPYTEKTGDDSSTSLREENSLVHDLYKNGVGDIQVGSRRVTISDFEKEQVMDAIQTAVTGSGTIPVSSIEGMACLYTDATTGCSIQLVMSNKLGKKTQRVEVSDNNEEGAQRSGLSHPNAMGKTRYYIKFSSIDIALQCIAFVTGRPVFSDAFGLLFKCSSYEDF